ncbi:O-antigen ligase family protein [Microbacterium oleivorans]|uniref:O-antigen ligase family protein n=1 Tax=Microbacterium oleivorans TaxID=273677 RepID=UPI00341FC56B
MTGQIHITRRDPVAAGARGLLYLGLFFSALLVIRVGGLTAGDVFIIGALALAAVTRVLNPAGRAVNATRLAVTVVLFTMFTAAAALATINAIVPDESLTVAVRIALVAFGLPWLAATLLPEPRLLARAAGWFVAGAAFSASGTLLQYTLGGTIIPGAEVTNAGRFPGWTGHVSDLGGITAVGIAIGLGFLLKPYTVRGRTWGLLAVGVAAIGLILSGSVSGMLAAVIAAFVYLIRGALRPGAFIVIGVAATVVGSIALSVQAAASALSPIDRLMQVLGLSQGGLYSTSEIRADTYAIAWQEFIANPIVGHGLDPASTIVDGVFPAHNLLLGAAYQGGILLTIAIAALALRPLAGGWVRADRSVLTTQLLAGLGAALVFAMTAPSLYNRYFWIPVALVAAARVMAERRTEASTLDLTAARRLSRA